MNWICRLGRYLMVSGVIHHPIPKLWETMSLAHYNTLQKLWVSHIIKRSRQTDRLTDRNWKASTWPAPFGCDKDYGLNGLLNDYWLGCVAILVPNVWLKLVRGRTKASYIYGSNHMGGGKAQQMVNFVGLQHELLKRTNFFWDSRWFQCKSV